VTQPIPKLPLWTTVKQSYVLTFQNVGWFARMAWLWLLILLAVMAAFYWFYFPYRKETTTFDSSLFWDLLALLPGLMVGSSLAVAWHRRLLANNTSPGHFFFRLDRTVFRYFGWATAFSMAVLLPWLLFWAYVETSMPSSAPDPSVLAQEADPLATSQPPADGSFPIGAQDVLILLSGLFVLPAAFSYIPTRLTLLLPALALGHSGYGAGQSWRHTSGNFWRMYLGTALVFVAPLTAYLVLMVLLEPPIESMSRVQYVVSNCITELTTILIGMTSLTFLSLAYRHFTGLPQAASTPSADS
jgi:hypothetical protein